MSGAFVPLQSQTMGIRPAPYTRPQPRVSRGTRMRDTRDEAQSETRSYTFYIYRSIMVHSETKPIPETIGRDMGSKLH